jgi:glycosyltransferase involved in cell wall biosynthesis
VTKIKIGIFIDSRKKSGGAYQEFLYILNNIKEKANKFSNMEFLFICTSKNLDLNLEEKDINFLYFDLNFFDRFICYLRNYGPFARRIKKYFFFKNKFEDFLKKNNVQLIYFSGPSQYSLYLENTKFFINIPDVSHRENLEFPEIVDNAEFFRKEEIFKNSLPRAIAIITNSEIIKKRISFFYNILEDKIFIINHMPSLAIQNFLSIDLNRQKIFRDKFKIPKGYIFYPAMYLPHKNHITLIHALKFLKEYYKISVSAVFCGNDIGYLNNLKNYVKKVGLKNEIFFLDFVEDEYLPYLYLDASILVMTSLIGPTNIPPWESFKMKIPVIYSNLEGIKEVLADSVIYVDPLNFRSIADAMFKVISDKDLKEQLILKGSLRLKEIQDNNDFDVFFKIINKYGEYLKLIKY